MTDLEITIRAYIDARTDDFGRCEQCERGCSCEGCGAFDEALTAVLDAHTSDRLDPEARPHCRECSSIAGRRVWTPCSTVRTIARGMGVRSEYV